MAIDSIEKLKAALREAGADKLYVKPLAPNDNSKNQPYLGGDFSALTILPFGKVEPQEGGKRPNFKAPLDFYWLKSDGALFHAPHAQLILYPDYPEVRLSGFLRGSRDAPNNLMTSRETGRILFLGVTHDGRIIAHVVAANTALARAFRRLGELPQTGVFSEIMLDTKAKDSRALLLKELKRIHLKDWIVSKRLDKHGNICSCDAQNCGGLTLEAELGIKPNGYADPDFHGWEVKQYAVNNFQRLDSGILTLMTPEPTGGFYKDKGVEAFLRKYGYPDKNGREDRYNFGGTHKVGIIHSTTNMTVVLDGFDCDNTEITNPGGGIVLLDKKGNKAAEWGFAGIIDHWKRKHAKAVYVPSLKGSDPRQYKYGDKVKLAVGTDPLKFLAAMAKHTVYYDPGIKLEEASSDKPKIKRRSQFRVHSKDLASLYDEMRIVDVTTGKAQQS